MLTARHDDRPMPDICIVDYGMGNLGSVANAFRFLGIEARITADAEELRNADAYVLPGVGAFGEAMHNLESSDLIEVLENGVRADRKPFLGICLGLQLIAAESEEKGHHEGLGWIDGRVVEIPAAPGIRVPHVGWTGIDFESDPLFERIGQQASFYFDHSFHLECADDLVLARCRHGRSLVAAVRHGNILAAQFHPEKSQKNGLKLLRNFVNMCYGTDRIDA